MSIAICIVGFRNADDIARCLEALSESTHADFDVVICENGGPESYEVLRAATPSVLPGGQQVRIVAAPRNLGYAGGINVCIAEAPEAEAWWILNPDTLPEPDALEHMVKRLEEGDCEAVGCTICTPSGEVESRGGRWWPWLARAESLERGLSPDEPTEAAAIEAQLSWLSGASMLVSRAFVQAAGLMREDYFLYAEEVEWCLRGQALGLKLGVAPASRVLHHQGTTTGSVADISQRSRTSVYLDERNKMLLTRDRFPGRLPVAAIAAFALIFLRFARRRAWRQLGFALQGWAAGLRDQRGAPEWI
jgi:N-acetylglucosaminyl-diphospho-decaprenol L-rhamnosyltransferase